MFFGGKRLKINSIHPRRKKSSTPEWPSKSAEWNTSFVSPFLINFIFENGFENTYTTIAFRCTWRYYSLLHNHVILCEICNFNRKLSNLYLTDYKCELCWLFRTTNSLSNERDPRGTCLGWLVRFSQPKVNMAFIGPNSFGFDLKKQFNKNTKRKYLKKFSLWYDEKPKKGDSFFVYSPYSEKLLKLNERPQLLKWTRKFNFKKQISVLCNELLRIGHNL